MEAQSRPQAAAAVEASKPGLRRLGRISPEIADVLIQLTRDPVVRREESSAALPDRTTNVPSATRFSEQISFDPMISYERARFPVGATFKSAISNL